MNFFKRSDDPNTLVGIILLIFLAVIAGPKVFPELVASLPLLDEGISCESLRTGENRAEHQSLLGRDINARESSPISLAVRIDSFPIDVGGNPTSDIIDVTIVVTNNTIAPVPLLIPPIRPGANLTQPQSGFGLLFNRDGEIPAAVGETPGQSYPEEWIRLLGPRQICLYRVKVPVSAFPPTSTFVDTNTAIRAFYRNTQRGTILAPNPAHPFTDQGLWVGLEVSPPFPLHRLGTTTTTSAG